jgi:hypothetical protein
MENKKIYLINKYNSSIRNKIYFSNIFINSEINNIFELIDFYELNDAICSEVIYKFKCINNIGYEILEIREELLISVNLKNNKKEYTLFNEHWCGEGVEIIYQSYDLEEVFYQGYYFLNKLFQKYKNNIQSKIPKYQNNY